MHIHELNPWRTLIALSVFVILALIAFYVTWLIEKRVRKTVTPFKFE